MFHAAASSSVLLFAQWLHAHLVTSMFKTETTSATLCFHLAIIYSALFAASMAIALAATLILFQAPKNLTLTPTTVRAAKVTVASESLAPRHMAN